MAIGIYTEYRDEVKLERLKQKQQDESESDISVETEGEDS